MVVVAVVVAGCRGGWHFMSSLSLLSLPRMRASSNTGQSISLPLILPLTALPAADIIALTDIAVTLAVAVAAP